MAKKAKVKDPNKKSLWAEFKEFINKGNAFMLAVGVVIGGAFNAIVTSLVNILMSVATWAVPGGLKGLVTVLPAVNAAQRGMSPDTAVEVAEKTYSLGQSFNMKALQALAEKLAIDTYGADTVLANPNLIESVKSTIVEKYTLHGTLYTYKMSAVIDWGAFINAVIAFIIIAITLFVIVKVTTVLAKKREEAKAKIAAKVAEKGKKEEADLEKEIEAFEAGEIKFDELSPEAQALYHETHDSED